MASEAMLSWVVASRPKTLVASMVPVAVGSSLAFSDCGLWDPLTIFLCLLFSCTLQVATNFANDYFDGKKGADQDRTLAPQRVLASGLISEFALFWATIFLLFLGLVIGLLLIFHTGSSTNLIFLGILCLVCSILYTGGPYPLAYNGLGDLFVIMFFGYVAVGGTHYLIMSKFEKLWILEPYSSLAVGLIINNLLVVNNYRDYEQDKINNKKTLIVRLGRKFGEILYLTSLSVACLLIAMIGREKLYPLLVLPWGIWAFQEMRNAVDKKGYDRALALTAITVLSLGVVVVLNR